MAALQRVTGFFAIFTKKKVFDRVMEKVKIVSADNGKVEAELLVAEEHQNAGGTLHGGLTATLVDCMTTLAILSFEHGRPGVSIDLNVSYISPAKTGDLVTITAECLKMGKTMAFTTAELRLKDGRLVARGNHTKHLGSS